MKPNVEQVCHVLHLCVFYFIPMQTRMNVSSPHIIVTATPCARILTALTIVHAWMATVVMVLFVPTLMNAHTTTAEAAATTAATTLTVQCVIETLTVQIHQATIPVNVKGDTLVMVTSVQVKSYIFISHAHIYSHVVHKYYFLMFYNVILCS